MYDNRSALVMLLCVCLVLTELRRADVAPLLLEVFLVIVGASFDDKRTFVISVYSSSADKTGCAGGAPGSDKISLHSSSTRV